MPGNCDTAALQLKGGWAELIHPRAKSEALLCDHHKRGMGWEVGGRFKREVTYVYLWLIHVDVWQKPTEYCKEIIFQ